MRRAIALAVLVAGPALAEPRPAPDAFIEVTFATTTAQALAQACPTLSFALLKASRASGEVMAALEADGFTLDALADEMIDPAPRFETARRAFLERHDLVDGAASDAVCRAGLAEIADATQIGDFLTEVPGE